MELALTLLAALVKVLSVVADRVEEDDVLIEEEEEEVEEEIAADEVDVRRAVDDADAAAEDAATTTTEVEAAAEFEVEAAVDEAGAAEEDEDELDGNATQGEALAAVFVALIAAPIAFTNCHQFTGHEPKRPISEVKNAPAAPLSTRAWASLASMLLGAR